jgi:8-oxo-dGTP diphosphatase
VFCFQPLDHTLADVTPGSDVIRENGQFEVRHGFLVRQHLLILHASAQMYNQHMRAKFPVTIHLLFFREDQVLLLRRFNTGYADGQYSVPAGHLDGGETVVAAAAREAREETGVRIEAGQIGFSSVLHRNEGEERVDFFVHVHQWQGEPVNIEPDKCDELRWMNVNHLPENTIPYVRKAIQNHLTGIPFDEFGW